MAPIADELKRVLDELEQQRDELRVQLHLARADARTEWEELERKLEHLRARVKGAGREAGHAAEDVRSAVGLVVDELRKGYARVAAAIRAA
jgi:hypothetical protein